MAIGLRLVRRLTPSPPALTLEALYREHFDFVFRIAKRIGGPYVDAEDVTQEVFLVVQRRLHTFNNTSTVKTWLYSITVNIVRSTRRKWWRRISLLNDDSLEERPARIIDSVEVKEAYRITYEILEKLAPKKREAFILAELEGLTAEEIAQLVGAKAETIWSRLHYARREFAEHLALRLQRAD